MGSKGPKDYGDFAKDYSSINPQWIDAILISDEELENIINQGKVRFSKQGFIKLKSEIETYIFLKTIEIKAKHKGGSGRSNDFFGQHINSLAHIYKKEGGKITLGRLNPSRKHPYGYASSNFITLCEAVNNVLPKIFQKSKAIDSNPNQGLTRAIRRALTS
jgi:hypothetical protein